MKNPAETWLTGRASLPGTLACGLKEPGGGFLCHSVEEICPETKLREILGQFDNLHSAFFLNQLAPLWSTWVFEHGVIRFVQRTDGWLLALVVRQDSDAYLKLDTLAMEFIPLDLAG